MKIAIASGKGRTGKTTVSLSLYYFLSKELNNRVQLIDCDVEEPNDLLFFPEIEAKDDTKQTIAYFKKNEIEPLRPSHCIDLPALSLFHK